VTGGADHQHADEEADRGRGLDVARVVAALVVGHVLRHVGRGAAVLTAEREALRQAQEHEQRGSPETQRRVRGQEADQRGAHAHRGHGDEERVLAADQITDVTEHQRAQRAHAKAGAEGREAGEELSGVVAGRKKLLPEEHGEASVQIEIVPLEQCADRRRRDHAAQGLWVDLGVCRVQVVCRGRHAH